MIIIVQNALDRMNRISKIKATLFHPDYPIVLSKSFRDFENRVRNIILTAILQSVNRFNEMF